MGPAAGVDFLRLFVQACTLHLHESNQLVCDQNFPEHWLAQVPLPDRTSALKDTQTGFHQPLEPMLQTLGRLAAIGVRSVAIACNTAHAWHEQLQSRFPQLELLHVAKEVALQLTEQGVQSVALMATEGTYRVGLYEQALKHQGIHCYVPNDYERERIMHGIYQGVKAGSILIAQQCFEEVALNLTVRYGEIPLILGCTEIPLGLLNSSTVSQSRRVDPARILAKALASRAYI